jgi:hypothetical protein
VDGWAESAILSASWMEAAPVGVGPLTQDELAAAILGELRQRSISGFQDCGPRTYPASRCSRCHSWRLGFSARNALLMPIPALPDSFRELDRAHARCKNFQFGVACFGMHSTATDGRAHADRVGPVAALRAFGASRQFPAMSDPPNIKPEARRLVDSLPDSATWDDLACEVYVRQSVEAGLADADAGRIVTHDEALARVRARIRRAS